MIRQTESTKTGPNLQTRKTGKSQNHVNNILRTTNKNNASEKSKEM